jgi:hypothetical protein
MRASIILLTVWFMSSVASAEILSFVKLKPEEMVVIVYRSVGCFHTINRVYQIEGGTPARFSIVERKTYQRGWRLDDGKNRIIGVGKLREVEAFGLDAYLLFLRQGFKGDCTTTNDVVVGYYRGGKKMGEERFQDATCSLSSFHWENGRVVASEEEDRPKNFSGDIFKAIVPPRLVEERITKEQSHLPELPQR